MQDISTRERSVLHERLLYFSLVIKRSFVHFNGDMSRTGRRLSPHRIADVDPAGLLSDDSDFNNLINDILESSDGSDESIDLDYLTRVRGQRLRRTCSTYPYEGDIMQCIFNKHPEDHKNWASLPAHERERRWMDEFRMNECEVLELLEMAAPHMEPSIPSNSTMRVYGIKEKLLVTLNFLAHSSSLRQLGSKWGMPHSSIAVVVLKPTVSVLRWLFIINPATKIIKWPKEVEEQQRVMKGFRDRCNVPGCIGAIDGSLIPMKKPTKQQANQDSDSYYGYKGGIASLLLAVCDIKMRFIYVNAGAPACVGDAGLFQRSRLGHLIREGLLTTADVTLYFEDAGVEKIFPYLVGDAAFPLGRHMMKAIDPVPADDTPEKAFNTRILLARRVIERAFGRLKGRWAFCRRNTFWNSLDFCREAIEACCGLHNFLQERAGEDDEDNEDDEDDEEEGDDAAVGMMPLPPDNAQQGAGQEIRGMLVDWVEEH
jgi:hypothetical protein